MDDLTAIEKCLKGEKDAFRFLVERYQKQAVGHAVAILGNREDALDAVQEAFIDAFQSLQRFDRTRRFYPWFYVLLRNRCYKMTARKRETESIGETEILAAQAGLPNEERFALEKALLSLPQEDREIITLKYLDGLSYEELAEHLQIPRGTVMSRLFYARKQLQAKLTGKFH
ncbi:MAG TPA: RNA polymerase sigma factor [Pyrinomonadaceae bacterium]|nr:RNA polymerase sigma factor [Pyrinomonadaceae bacterium]